VGDVVGPDQDDRDVGVGQECLVDLSRQVLRLGPDDRELAQVHPAVQALGNT
jgi:hypothetical protein